MCARAAPIRGSCQPCGLPARLSSVPVVYVCALRVVRGSGHGIRLSFILVRVRVPACVPACLCLRVCLGVCASCVCVCGCTPASLRSAAKGWLALVPRVPHLAHKGVQSDESNQVVIQFEGANTPAHKRPSKAWRGKRCWYEVCFRHERSTTHPPPAGLSRFPPCLGTCLGSR